MRVFATFVLALLVLRPMTAVAQTATDLFDPATVHRLDLLVNSRDWEKLRADFQLNEYYPADLRWNGVTIRNVGIRSRGLGSRSGVKPALRIDINRYVAGQEFLGLKSILLDNLVQDPTGIKEAVAMRLYQRMGVPAPREAHVALYVNDAYAGLYGVIEAVDKSFLARVFGEREPGDVENDGYLFEYAWLDPWRWDYLGTGLDAYAPRFDPKTHEHASVAELYAPIEEMVRAINHEGDFLASVAPYVDVRLLMRQLAVQNFIAELDGILGGNGTANFHLYRFEGRMQSQFIPWDEDRAFQSADWPILQFHDAYVLMRRAMSVPELRAAYYDGLLEATATAVDVVDVSSGTGWLEQEIRARRTLVTPFMHADAVKPYSNEEFEAAMDALVAFPAARADFVRAEVHRMR